MKGRGKGTKRLGGVLMGLMALGCWMTPAFAEDSAARIEQLAQKVQQLQTQQEETQRQLKTLLEELGRIKGNPANPGSALAGGPSMGKGKEGEKEDDYFEVTTTGSGPGSSTRVSSLAEGLDFHGYLDLNYTDKQDSGVQGNPSFDNNHLTLWTGWRLSDKVYAKAELEYEHAPGVEGGGSEGEIKVEVAQIDVNLTPNARLSLGSMIVPFGIEAEAHASPVNRLVTRPQAARQIIKGTWTDVGVWGNYTLPKVGELALFVVNGDARNGGINRDDRGTGHRGKSMGGRLRFNQLVPGLDFGVSLVNGKYDSQNDQSATRLGLHLAANLKQLFSLNRDLTVVGEWFGGRDEGDSSKKGLDGKKRDAKREGWYLQLAQGLMPGLEAIARFGEYDTDREAADNLHREFSLGLGYTPLPNLRFKVEYQWNREQGRNDVDNNLVAGQAVVAW